MTNNSEVLGFSGWKFDNPPRYDPLWFEVIAEEYWMNFFTDYWQLPYYTGGIYLATILRLQNYMKSRKPIQLKTLLFLWNTVIGLFSIVGFVRTAPEMFGILSSPNGFYRSICGWTQQTLFILDARLLFILSKYIELGDTIFILLRKKPLMVLQWYHHVITLIATWTAGKYVEAIGRWYAVMNYGVHSLMYPYFALKVLNVKVPSLVASFITSMQLLQMLIGLFVNFYSVRLINSGTECDRHPNSIRLFSLIYFSFTLLFGNLFYDVVITRHFRLSKDKNKQA